MTHATDKHGNIVDGNGDPVGFSTLLVLIADVAMRSAARENTYDLRIELQPLMAYGDKLIAELESYLCEIEMFYESLPPAIKRAYDRRPNG